LGFSLLLHLFQSSEHGKRRDLSPTSDNGLGRKHPISSNPEVDQSDLTVPKIMNNKIYEDLSLIFSRAKITFFIIKILFVILILYFWKLQILDFQIFWQRSEANRIREIVVPPQRGLIRDRNGVVLAKNIAAFKASLIRENCKNYEDSCSRIAELLGLEPDVLKERVEKYTSLPLFQPVVVKDNLTYEEVARIKSRQYELPELIIQSEPKRNYPFGTLASHVLGYLQEISPAEMEMDRYKSRRMGDLIGKTGLEKQYEDILVGTDGKVFEVVDSLGREIREISRTDPIRGNEIHLTLDFDLQKKAEEILDGREGAVVVMKPETGEILAMASFPNFNPNSFINRFTPEEWVELITSPEYPLENRTIRGLYSPGSLFKPNMLLAGLDSGVVNESTTSVCRGSIIIYGHPFACWKAAGHGTVNLYSAIQHSCNIYFYQLGKRLGIGEIARYARMHGLGSSTQIDLPGEKTGLVPDPDWKKRVRDEPWYPGETISVSIGQGPLLVTPLQIAVHTAQIANRGLSATPYLFAKEIKEGNEIPRQRSNRRIRSQVSEAHFEKVVQGMWQSVNRRGTSILARIQDFDVCGKTGSAQVVSTATAEKLAKQKREIKTHSWFTGFAPKDRPEVVVSIIVEYGGGGGATAAPSARELFELYREKYD
jgi:penicillin-binding protein 2